MLTFDQTNDSQAGNFIYPQWIITPLQNNKWLLIVSGIVVIDATSGQNSGWRRDTVRILPDFDGPFSFAGNDVENDLERV
jgi:hypothetical protein